MKKLFLSLLVFSFALSWAPTSYAQSDLSQLFKKVKSAVVLVFIEQTTPTGKREKRKELGSGVLISKSGRILTAAHLVQTADNVVVEFIDGTRVPARVTASVPMGDVAELQLLGDIPKGIHITKLADSDKAEVGEQIFVIGAPLGISHTLTVGHISARRKPGAVVSGLEPEFFQTDAAINQGNSGGPLFNMDGHVIGIVSHIITRSGGSEGLGFAITANTAQRLLTERHPFWSGMEGYLLQGKMATIFNLPQSAGLLIEKVAKNSPAAKIGLKAGNVSAKIDGTALIVGGDIILAAQGIPLQPNETYIEIHKKFKELKQGDAVQLDILRDGKTMSLTAQKS